MIDKKIKIIKDDEIDLKALFKVLNDARNSIFKFTFISILIAFLYSLLATPLYKSTITIYPNNEGTSGKFSQLQGMASSFGFNVGSVESSFHILDIINSRPLSKSIYNQWEYAIFDAPMDLINYWEINNQNKIIFNSFLIIKKILDKDNKDKALALEEGTLEKLSKRISVKKARMV